MYINLIANKQIRYKHTVKMPIIKITNIIVQMSL